MTQKTVNFYILQTCFNYFEIYKGLLSLKITDNYSYLTCKF